MKTEINMGTGTKLSVYRQRPATTAERKKDPDARIMAEWVHITFGSGKPAIEVNRDLCD